VMVNSDLSVMGNEASPRRGQSSARQPNRLGQGTGAPANASRNVEVSQGEAMQGLNPVNRQTGAVASEAAIEAYSDLVDSYFKAITTRKSP
jgi:hypothetical protein